MTSCPLSWTTSKLLISSVSHLIFCLPNHLMTSALTAIDCEFTGLSADPSLDSDLFDSPDDRYKKLRQSARKLTICQFGVCTFTRSIGPTESTGNALTNRYEGKCFTFFLCPRSFSDKKSKKMMINTSSMEFLNDHSFNFEKWLKNGIPFMNQQEEEYLQDLLHNGDIVTEICNERDDRMDQMFSIIDQVKTFQGSSNGSSSSTSTSDNGGDVKDKDPMQILIPFTASVNQFRNFAMIKRLRQIFPSFWIRLLNGHLLVKRMPDEDQEEREARDLSYAEEEEQAVEYMRGFSRVIQSMVQGQKVIVGHNCFTDLVFMYQHLIADLPKKLNAFKRQLQSAFPMIYDTKHIVMNVKKTIPELKFLHGTGLSSLYDQLGIPEYAASFHYNPVIELMSDENAVGESDLSKIETTSHASLHSPCSTCVLQWRTR